MSWCCRRPTHSRPGQQRTGLSAQPATRASSAASPTAAWSQVPCAHAKDRRGALEQRLGSHAPEHGQQKKNTNPCTEPAADRKQHTTARQHECVGGAAGPTAGRSQSRRKTYNDPEHVDKEHCHSALYLHEVDSQVAPTSARPPNSSANTNAHQKRAANSVRMDIRTRKTRTRYTQY